MKKTITREELDRLAMTTGGERKIHKVIDNGMVFMWVGIGWVAEAPPTRHQKRHLHHVINTAPKEVRHGSGQRKEEGGEEVSDGIAVQHDRRPVPAGDGGEDTESLHLQGP